MSILWPLGQAPGRSSGYARSMASVDAISALLAKGDAAAPALQAPGRASLSRAQLRELVATARKKFNALGIGRGERVAIVLPNGPATATAFLSVAGTATAAPLNPSYRREEMDFFLADLEAKALVTAVTEEGPAPAAAEALGIPVVRLVEDKSSAGAFHLEGIERHTSQAGPAEIEDVALVLHTSGTTSRPKLVPLTHKNLAASARNIGIALDLGETDLCLNVMPLFHIHGLVAALCASLAAGGSVAATPGFDAFSFFRWMEEIRPTWYTAVPTMHQMMLARSDRHQETIKAVPLRFVRSSSASLAPSVMEELEKTLGVPVIESYGMTEAAHQMASNPLPPGERKPGSVGIAAGPEVAVMDAAGNLLPVGETGEVVIRGENVTAGYIGRPEANAEAFINSWFRTGDQGMLDEDGYLHLRGRLKEIVNRGGEKISPKEVDEALLAHPGVAQAIAFAIPHPKLGEDIAAAVVTSEGEEVKVSDLREFVAERLAPFKVPRKILFVEEIPKGPTGKLQRIGLAAKLGLDA